MSPVPHTPVPWFLEESDGTIRSKAFGRSDQMADYRGNIVCDLRPALGGWPSLGRKHAEPETRANAGVICTAPAFYVAVLGDDTNALGRLAWLQALLARAPRWYFGYWESTDEDPQATYEMFRECRDLLQQLVAAKRLVETP
ncbi:MAG: hypothetical protein K2R98_28350 [Gemmataceae bacterium]|nr:hypothetical protein [Gemmataceae bacterium]